MSHLDNGFRSLNLKRFPETDDVNPLQAWEAADEYLLQQLDETEIRGPSYEIGRASCRERV